MKTIKLTLLFLVLPLVFHAQTLTGLWTGTLSNDSNTVRKDQQFEIVLTQYKDKVYGYSRMTFIVNDTLYYIVKRVKGTIEDDVCQVKDDDIISHNFPRKPDKGVHLVSTFRRNKEDSIWKLDGDWKTTETKRHRYYSISGRISLKTEPDLEKSKLFPHLEELKLASDVAFYQESKKAKQEQEQAAIAKQSVANNKKEPVARETKPQPALVKEPPAKEIAKTTVKTETPVVTQPVNEPAKTTVALKEEKLPAVAVRETKNEPIANNQPVAAVKEPVKEIKKETQQPAPVKSEPIAQIKQPVKETKKEEPPVIKPEVLKTEPVAINKPVEQKKDNSTELAKTEVKKPEITNTVAAPKENPPPVMVTTPATKPVIPAAAVNLAERKIAAPQIVFFKSDSLELSLYDNGEVDGDTVSVLLNGELILAKQGLKTSAIKKTVYVPAGKSDSLTLVLYAENLGKYPPNTGLLVVHDGEDVYQIRFSADLQQNAAVIFKRKRN